VEEGSGVIVTVIDQGTQQNMQRRVMVAAAVRNVREKLNVEGT
jgi:hypothetical protein